MGQQLSAAGRIALDQHFANTANAFEVTPGNPAAGQHYAATPTVAQTIYEKVVEDGNAFLRMINGNVMVSEIKGEKVGLSLSGLPGSRTDTSGAGERIPVDLSDTDSKTYECFATEFDIALPYSKIDAWAKFPDFAARYMKLVRQGIGNALLTTGWHGVSVAATTDPGTNTLLQDLNKGWLQQMREFNAGAQYVLGAAGSVTLGGATYGNLDVLAHEAKLLLPVYHQRRDDLVLLVGGDVISYQDGTYYETNGNTPSEKAQLAGRITKAYANMPAIAAPFFPDGAIAVTTLDNLSIYIQDTSVRRTQKDKPEKNQVQDFNSANIAYVIEDEELMAFIEGIEFA